MSDEAVMALAQLRVVVRLTLLAALTVGVVGVHPTGHPPTGHCGSAVGHALPGDATTSVAAMSEPVSVFAGASTRTMVTVPLPACGMPAWQMCLAVLTGVALVLLAAATACLALRMTATLPMLALRMARAVRGPPRPPLCLTLADLSVLRV